MGKFNDLTGQKFGRLTVVSRAENAKNNRARWNCICDCGNPEMVTVEATHLKQGKIKSCGCYMREMSSINGKKRKKYNTYEFKDDYVIIYTTSKKEIYVDLADFDKVKDICWWIMDCGYVQGIKDGKKILMHRYIMDASDDVFVDHKHGKLTRNDNRRCNLRIATASENCKNRSLRSDNTSGCTGVCWHKATQRWAASIYVNGKGIHIGEFDIFEDAVKARKEAEEKYFGEWSYDNSQKTN